MRKIKVLIINSLVLFLMLFFFLELIYPKIFPSSNLTYRFWNDKPVTFYPNKKFRVVNKNYDNTFKSNSLGFNDKEIEHEIDILIIGDSFVQAYEVNSKDHFATHINNEFPNLKIMKIGLGGYGNDKYFSSYIEVGKKFNPKLVIIFNVGNDIRNLFCDINNSNCDHARNINKIQNNKDLKKYLKLLFIEKDDYKFNKNKRNELSFKKIILREFISKFNTYYSIRNIISKFKKYKELKINKVYSDSLNTGYTNDTFMKNYINLSKNKTIFNYYKKINDLIYNTIVNEDNKKLLFVTINKDVRNRLNVAQNSVNDAIVNSINTKGYNHIYLDKLMKENYAKTNLLPNWKDDEHWNEIGHKQVADILIKYLKNNYLND